MAGTYFRSGHLIGRGAEFFVNVLKTRALLTTRPWEIAALEIAELVTRRPRGSEPTIASIAAPYPHATDATARWGTEYAKGSGQRRSYLICVKSR
jgi:hypothetical protein